jgi:hypothetical protein
VSFSSTDDGGSSIKSYHLQYKETYSGDWIDVKGLNIPSLSSIYKLNNLTTGTSYSFRFRALNSIGWSDFSDESIYVAAGVPD